MIEQKLNFVWDTPNGVAAYALDEETLDLMKQSGCYQLNLALESGNQDVLNKIIKKPLKLERVKPLIKYAKKIGLDVGIYLIIGMPGEKIEQMYDSFRMCVDLGVYDPFISVATPYPGSELYDNCVNNGYLGSGFSLDDLYIRSFSINTPDWRGEQLKEVLANGYTYLFWQKMKDQPIRYLIPYLFKALRDPRKILQKLPQLKGYARKFIKGNFVLDQKEVKP